MGLLNQSEVRALNIVVDGIDAGWRATTYDATIGNIITKKGVCNEEVLRLGPREIAWVISKERFTVPKNVTGITTLRTTWTRKGLLTLTVGIVDPSYDGYLSTAVINFSNTAFSLQKGDTFFRTAFFQHEEADSAKGRLESEEGYRKSVIQESNLFSETFLTVDSLAEEVAANIFGMPKIATRVATIIGIIALLIGFAGLIVPPALNLSKEVAHKNARIELLEDRLKKIEERLVTKPSYLNPDSQESESSTETIADPAIPPAQDVSPDDPPQ